ncbi:MAG: hypothetical protein HN368_15070 [Spirochaetales bacterium]|jgi:uncharacterized protein|nr:hypothetical protein [Spirochaetales bacterium]
MKKQNFSSYQPRSVVLTPGIFRDRYELNRAYLAELKPKNLLQNYYLEAGRGDFSQLRNTTHGEAGTGDDRHWGWESPTCQVRGHFLGHWLSAAYRCYANTGEPVLKNQCDEIVGELEKCQEKNGGEWLFSIPEKYFRWAAEGSPTWAPHYVVHKTLMGLIDAVRYGESAKALGILEHAAGWFYSFVKDLTAEALGDLLDIETGGMMEVWADLFYITGEETHRELIYLYARNRLFDALLNGEDALTNKHANTTIPEVLGAARAYEVTGEERWLKIVKAYWKCAVDDRGFYCTGGQTSGEIWTPPFEYASRRGDKNQEHCTVYNMMRLADFLFRFSGDSKYADYIEMNLYNGILAQQNPVTGMISYFLPLEGGARKIWGSKTNDFWCCHGTLVQAHAEHNGRIYYGDKKQIIVAQYISSCLETDIGGTPVRLELEHDLVSTGGSDDNAGGAGERHRPEFNTAIIRITGEKPREFSISLRVPDWMEGEGKLSVNDVSLEFEVSSRGFCTITRTWHQDTIRFDMPKKLTVCEIPDEPDTVAFLHGPVVLAGLAETETALYGGKDDPSGMLVPDNERQWAEWLKGYRTVGQPVSIRFRPLYEIVDEKYSVYFPLLARPPYVTEKAGHIDE